jgi:hypothetical protein
MIAQLVGASGVRGGDAADDTEDGVGDDALSDLGFKAHSIPGVSGKVIMFPPVTIDSDGVATFMKLPTEELLSAMQSGSLSNMAVETIPELAQMLRMMP